MKARRAATALVVAGALLAGTAGAIAIAFERRGLVPRPNPRGELAPPSSESLSFVAVADCGSRPGVLLAAFADAAARPADILIVGGDLVRNRSPFELAWGTWLLDHAPTGIPLVLAIGNHETWDRHDHATTSDFEALFGPTQIWCAKKNALFVTAETGDYNFPADRERALDAILAEHRPKARFAVLVSHILPRLGVRRRDKRGADKTLEVEDTQRLLGLCRRHRIDLVIGGHFHGFAQEQAEGTTFLTAGGGGSPLDDPASTYHFVRVTLDERGVTPEVVPVANHLGAEWARYQLLEHIECALGLGGALGIVGLALRRRLAP